MFNRETILNDLLLSKHYLISDTPNTDKTQVAYYNAYLLSNFGIEVNKPEYLTREVLEVIAHQFKLEVPRAFYKNPQDTIFYTTEELLLEQLVNYFFYGADMDRVELFTKTLPEYVVGDELKLRNFYIISTEESHKVFEEITESYCAYTRPFSATEMTEFVELFSAGYYKGSKICCRDNIFVLLELDKSFARFLDQKDIVKLSIDQFGAKADFDTARGRSAYQHKEFQHKLDFIASCLPYINKCPLSKRQAKYYNKICKLCNFKSAKSTNVDSPDKRAIPTINAGNVVEAARIYAENGSMLERRLRFLLSRANPVEAVEILNMLPAKNPIVLYQLISGLLNDSEGSRSFVFTQDKRVKTHVETDYEALWRKSRLNKSTTDLVRKICVDKINEYYKNLPSLGKIYVDPAFEKVAVPVNTSACGKGIDVLPTGSRVPCHGDYIRTFVYWKDAFDIDSSLMLVKDTGEIQTRGWFNYGTYNCPVARFSGDITGPKGSEYFDVDLRAASKAGYKYIVQTFHGYNSDLSSGEIYAGYQVKGDLQTKAWDPKNIEMQFRVIGDSRGCVAFAIDLDTREVIIINQILDSDERVISPAGFKTVEKLIKPEALDINMATILRNRGELVDTPEEADVIFTDKYNGINTVEVMDADNEVERVRALQSELLHLSLEIL